MLNIVTDLYTLVDSADWVDYNTIPADYKGRLPALPVLKVSIMEGKTDRKAYSTANKKKLYGLILVQIITESGKGQKEAATIADALDTLLEDRWLNENTQLFFGSYQFVGPDRDDSSKSISQYSIPFTYIGE